jgi:hypothetical protein
MHILTSINFKLQTKHQSMIEMVDKSGHQEKDSKPKDVYLLQV